MWEKVEFEESQQTNQGPVRIALDCRKKLATSVFGIKCLEVLFAKANILYGYFEKLVF